MTLELSNFEQRRRASCLLRCRGRRAHVPGVAVPHCATARSRLPARQPRLASAPTRRRPLVSCPVPSSRRARLAKPVHQQGTAACSLCARCPGDQPPPLPGSCCCRRRRRVGFERCEGERHEVAVWGLGVCVRGLGGMGGRPASGPFFSCLAHFERGSGLDVNRPEIV